MSFTNLKDATKSDIELIAKCFNENVDKLPDRLFKLFSLQIDELGGYPISRFEHGMQTATRAYRDGKDDEYVICALFHDIGDVLSPYNHADLAATILKPYISEKNFWMLKHHEVFQGYYFWGKLGDINNLRDEYKDNPYYQYTDDFCRLYDSPAFDKDYKSESIEFFKEMVKNFFSKVRYSSVLDYIETHLPE